MSEWETKEHRGWTLSRRDEHSYWLLTQPEDWDYIQIPFWSEEDAIQGINDRIDRPQYFHPLTKQLLPQFKELFAFRYVVVGGHSFRDYKGTTQFTGLSFKERFGTLKELKANMERIFEECAGLVTAFDFITGENV